MIGRGGMHRQSSGLVDSENLLIFKYDTEIPWRLRFIKARAHQDNDLSFTHPLACPPRSPIGSERTGLYDLLSASPRESRDTSLNKAV